MKQFILFLLLAGVVTLSAQAQCTPNPAVVAAGVPGIYPTPQNPLPDGATGVAYSQTLTVLVPADTTIDLSALIGFPLPPVTVTVNYQKVNGVTGLPNGFSSACNPVGCQWNGGGNGCILLSGTTQNGGPYTVNLDAVLNVLVPAGIPVLGGTNTDVPLPIQYDLTIVGPNSIGDKLDPSRFMVAGCYPNPASGMTTVRYSNPAAGAVTLRVTNALGEEVVSLQNISRAGINEVQIPLSGMTPGVYFWSLCNGKETTPAEKLVVLR